ncbi:PREDICTED: uncharacterized protein LOC109153954 [Ipomoea nil]|uniref:uncharacterized protein LOC109153954 n=1 Tax=Ipomoea nil TaxID=35883 RepID=UPI000900B1BE|nr:PREDICTED: uncharacterized protein LOC109153954 [Ipomoea nil]
MALSFDFKLAVLFAALFLLGAWASQAAAQETSMFERHARRTARHGRSYKGHVNKAKPFKIIQENVKFSSDVRPEKPIKTTRYRTGMDSEDETKTETPVVSSSPAAPTTTTTPPVQSSNSIPESVDRIHNRAEITDSIVQPHSQNCDENKRFMDGWSPLVIGAVLFYLLQPGLILQCPGNDKRFEFKTMKTNGKAMFNHTMIFIAIYAIIIALSHGKI